MEYADRCSAWHSVWHSEADRLAEKRQSEKDAINMKLYRISYTVRALSGDYRTSFDTYAHSKRGLVAAFSGYCDVSITEL